MKKAEWQAVYAPQGDALERRVRTTLDGLEEKTGTRIPNGALSSRRRWFWRSLRRPPWRPG